MLVAGREIDMARDHCLSYHPTTTFKRLRRRGTGIHKTVNSWKAAQCNPLHRELGVINSHVALGSIL